MKYTIVQRLLFTIVSMMVSIVVVTGFAPINTIQQQQQQQKRAVSTSIPTTTTTSYSTSTILQKLGRFEQHSMNCNSKVIKNRSSLTRMYGLFGLGGPELVVILIAAAFLLGPEKLAELGKDAGKIAGELKEVPKEFQAGLAEGEAQARALKSTQNTSTSTDSTTAASTTVEVTKTEEK